MSRHIMAFFTALCAFVVILAAGFGVCIIPKTTEVLATYTDVASAEHSPFTTQQLVAAAVAAEDYTMFSNDYGKVMDVIQRINIDAMTKYAGVSIDELAKAEDIYTLTPAALSHLDDCFALVNVARAFIIVFAVAGLVLAIILLTKGAEGRRSLSRALRWAAVLFALAIAGIGMYAAIDFNAFFITFHDVFFPQGNYMFSPNSLLICMYPEKFWVGMGIIWVVSSLVAGLLVFALGGAVKPRKAAN